VKSFSLFVIVAVVVCSFSLRPSSGQTVQDQTFVTKAIETNAAEVELSRMAQSKSENPRVRAFAEMMVKDHTTVLAALHRLDTGTSAVPPDSTGTETSQIAKAVPLSKEHEELNNRLSKLSGDDFDREYMNAMVQEHQKAIREYERETNSTSNASADSTTREKPQAGTQEGMMAQALLPIFKMHLLHAEALTKQVGVTGIPDNTYGGEETPHHMKSQ
jgi:putative membrane protein